jgi:CubicO group peptidase (beta-lactamase class C family)
MRSFLLVLLSSIVGLVLWTALVVIGTLDGWLHESLAPVGDVRAFMDAAVDEIDANRRGNVAFVLIEDGQKYDEYFASVGEPVDGDTLFQVASLSKWITAFGVMALVEEGKLDLDVPVSNYLTRWELPDSQYDNNGVTVRRLLSHTAGLTDGLGYAGFAPGTDVQALEDSLTRAADASPGADGRVRVGHAPGTTWQYSGGGYTLLQLLIEEVTDGTFESYLQRAVFKPLGMSRSTFQIDENNTSNLAVLYDVDGTPAVHYRFTSLAATSLYTTTSDLTRFIQAHLPGPNGEPVGRGVVKAETLKQMRQPHASQMGFDIWGLGTILYAPNDAGFVVGHDGNNEPAINTAARLNPETGDGIVILETGNELLATTLAGEWVFWQTGKRDFLMVTLAVNRTITMIVAGWVVILLAGFLIGWRLRRAGKTQRGA